METQLTTDQRRGQRFTIASMVVVSSVVALVSGSAGATSKLDGSFGTGGIIVDSSLSVVGGLIC